MSSKEERKHSKALDFLYQKNDYQNFHDQSFSRRRNVNKEFVTDSVSFNYNIEKSATVEYDSIKRKQSRFVLLANIFFNNLRQLILVGFTLLTLCLVLRPEYWLENFLCHVLARI